MQFRITMRTARDGSDSKRSLAQESTIRQLEPVNEAEESRAAQLRQEQKIKTEEEKAEELASRIHNIDDYFSETDSESGLNNERKAPSGHIDDYVVSEDESDLDGEVLRLTSATNGVHKALLSVQKPETKDDQDSSVEEEQKLDNLIELLASDRGPVSSVRDMNRNLLEHPDFEQLNSWMDAGTKDLCLTWSEQEKLALQEPQFHLT